ncbi:MAG: prepilin-type N-terminal cleavage/methylation domain-containing protein [Minisyncoccia bacterium]|jgi:general secretion pathway protein G
MNKKRQGFTLIEILIVVAIIAILASVVLVGLGPTQQAGRDARRLSDIRQVQNALELFYNKCGYYPGNVSGGACSTAAPSPATWTGFGSMLTAAGIGVSAIPGDPSSNRSYGYAYNSGNTAYVLGVALENPSNSVFNGYTAPSAAGYIWITDAVSIVPDTGCSKVLPAGSATYCVAL